LISDIVSFSMSNANKILKKMRLNPKDWRIEDFETVAKQHGVTVRKGGGSHAIFDHPMRIELLSVPARRPIKPIYVKKFIALIQILEKNYEQD